MLALIYFWSIDKLMAIRRPFINVVDRGLDPRVAHSKLDKKGNLLVQHGKAAPVLPQAIKEEIIVDDKKEVITESIDEVKPEEKDSKPATNKPEVKAEPKKTDKTPKPA